MPRRKRGTNVGEERCKNKNSSEHKLPPPLQHCAPARGPPPGTETPHRGAGRPSGASQDTHLQPPPSGRTASPRPPGEGEVAAWWGRGEDRGASGFGGSCEWLEHKEGERGSSRWPHGARGLQELGPAGQMTPDMRRPQPQGEPTAAGTQGPWPVSPSANRVHPRQQLLWWPLCPVRACFPPCRGWAGTQGPVTSGPRGAWPTHDLLAQCQLTAQVAQAEISAPLGSLCPLPNQWSQPQVSAPAKEDTGELGLYRGEEKPQPDSVLPQAWGPRARGSLSCPKPRGLEQGGECARQEASGASLCRAQQAHGPKGARTWTCPALHRVRGGPDPPRPQRREGGRGRGQQAKTCIPSPCPHVPTGNGSKGFGPWAPNRDFTPMGPTETTSWPLQSPISWHDPTPPSATDRDTWGPGRGGVERGQAGWTPKAKGRTS